VFRQTGFRQLAGMRKAGLDADLVVRDVGRRVSELRREHGLTQEQFAARAELSWKYLQQVEAGRENLTLRSLVRLANLLGVTLAELVQPPRDRTVRTGRPPRPPAKR
jgi:transcriptional regulator with XRE-family HTH domain